MGLIVTSRWVPVTERLPSTRRRVLATDGMLVYEAGVGADGRWYRSGTSMLLENYLVHPPTHWMALPDTPR